MKYNATVSTPATHHAASHRHAWRRSLLRKNPRATGKVIANSANPLPKEKLAMTHTSRHRTNFVATGRRDVATTIPVVRNQLTRNRTNWKPKIQFSACTGEKI